MASQKNFIEPERPRATAALLLKRGYPLPGLLFRRTRSFDLKLVRAKLTCGLR